jgi:cytochrome c biogenesis protein CcmG/thiol:disulfide interchange protein DsbE
MAKATGVGVILLMGLLWGTSGALYDSARTSDVAMSHYPPPQSDLPLLDASAAYADSRKDQSVNLGSIASGEPYLLNFWASWCVTCQAESRFLRMISDEVPIVGVALKDAPDAATRWLREFGSPYEFSYIDADGHYAEQLGVQGAPETFLIDGDGNVRFHYQGLLQETVWRERVMPILLGLRDE